MNGSGFLRGALEYFWAGLLVASRCEHLRRRTKCPDDSRRPGSAIRVAVDSRGLPHEASLLELRNGSDGATVLFPVGGRRSRDACHLTGGLYREPVCLLFVDEAVEDHSLSFVTGRTPSIMADLTPTYCLISRAKRSVSLS